MHTLKTDYKESHLMSNNFSGVIDFLSKRTLLNVKHNKCRIKLQKQLNYMVRGKFIANYQIQFGNTWVFFKVFILSGPPDSGILVIQQRKLHEYPILQWEYDIKIDTETNNGTKIDMVYAQEQKPNHVGNPAAMELHFTRV